MLCLGRPMALALYIINVPPSSASKQNHFHSVPETLATHAPQILGTCAPHWELIAGKGRYVATPTDQIQSEDQNNPCFCGH